MRYAIINHAQLTSATLLRSVLNTPLWNVLQGRHCAAELCRVNSNGQSKLRAFYLATRRASRERKIAGKCVAYYACHQRTRN